MTNTTSPSEASAGSRVGSRRIFPPQFKLQVLESYRRDADCRGNQRATARKFGIHRRQIQKWLQAETSLRAGLLRRAPPAAPSPPPFAAGSPESARLGGSPKHEPDTGAPASPHYQYTQLHTYTPQLVTYSPTHVTYSPLSPPSPMSSPAPAVAPLHYAVPMTAPSFPSPPPSLPPSPPPPAEQPMDLSVKRRPFTLFRPYLLPESPRSAFAAVRPGWRCSPASVR